MRKLAGLTLALLCVLGAAAAARAEDAANGEKTFKRICAACHSPLQDAKRLLGPTLFGVVNRHSGSVPGFRYSAANQKANLIWTPEILDKYLTNPKEVVPGTIMNYAGLKNAQDRADVIAYLQTLK